MRWGDGRGRGVGGEQGLGRTHEENLWENVKWERPVAPKSEHLGTLYEAWGGWERFSKVLRQPQAQLRGKRVCLQHPFLRPFSSNSRSGHPSAQ